LCQADKGLDAEQVGQHHRLLRQEFVKGLHSVCSRLDALSTAHVALGRLVGVVVGSQVVSEPYLPQEWQRRAFYYPLDEPLHRQSQPPPDFSRPHFHQNFILTGRCFLLPAVKNETPSRINKKSALPHRTPTYHPSTSDLPKKLVD
jgi:hypothetical protein